MRDLRASNTIVNNNGTLSVNSPLKYFVLSIDGGGVRGVIPSLLLKEIELRTGKPVQDLFDFMVGTSTGGLITLALGFNFGLERIMDLYTTRSSEIFYSSYLRTIKTGGGLWAPKYERDNLDNILDEFFAEKMLSDSTVPVCVTTYDLTIAGPKIWSSIDACKSESEDTYVKNVAAATSAAPTYFAPAYFEDASGEEHYAVDGGIFLNNPTVLAMLELLKNIPDAKAEEIFVLSLGTGCNDIEWNIDRLKNGGVVNWIRDGRIIDMMMDGSTDFATLQSKIIFPNLFRLQVDLPESLSSLDNASEENIEGLVQATYDYIESHDYVLDQVSAVLLEHAKMTTKPAVEVEEMQEVLVSMTLEAVIAI